MVVNQNLARVALNKYQHLSDVDTDFSRFKFEVNGHLTDISRNHEEPWVNLKNHEGFLLRKKAPFIYVITTIWPCARLGVRTSQDRPRNQIMRVGDCRSGKLGRVEIKVGNAHQ